MYLYALLVAWIAFGYLITHLWRSKYPPAVRLSAKGNTTVSRHHGPACMHPQVENVEVGDGILVPREVVAKICTSCFAQLPADYSSPSFVIMTTESSVPFPTLVSPLHHLSYWTEAQERLATGKEVNKCHE